MQSAFLTVVEVVGIVGLLGAVIALALSRGTWESLGRDRLLMESDLHDPRARAPAARSRDDSSERAAEIRQLLEARNRRRRRHGQAELDVETELARLLAAPAGDPPTTRSHPDPELVEEIRQLVRARNHRRRRRGQPPLDVEAEIERQIARLNG